jgi:hypothetical protein
MDFTLFYKTGLDLNVPWDFNLDFFISGYTASQRVKTVFEKMTAAEKRWIVFPEYGFAPHECPPAYFTQATYNEAELIQGFFAHENIDVKTKRIGVDITGFIRPHLIFLFRWLKLNGVRHVDAFYSEPDRYMQQYSTKFSDEVVTEIRQVAGCEGTHVQDTSKDVLVIGAGYDHELIAQVALYKEHAEKLHVLGFPSLGQRCFKRICFELP